MSMNIDTLSPQELAALIARANKRKKVLAKRKPAAQAKAAVAKALKATGWTFDELFGKPSAAAPAPAGKKTRKSKGPVSYTHLDVYKRQRWLRPATSALARSTAQSTQPPQ